MKILRTLYLAVLSLFVISCGSDTKNGNRSESDLERMDIRGQVKNILEVTAPASEKFNGDIETYEHILSTEDCIEFNEAGYIVSYSYTPHGDMDDGTLGSIGRGTAKKETREYNNTNKVTKIYKWSKYKTVENEDVAEYEYYDDDETLKYIKETELRKGGFSSTNLKEYFYDEKGEMTERIFSRSNLWKDDEFDIYEHTVFTYIYNDKGLLAGSNELKKIYPFVFRGEEQVPEIWEFNVSYEYDGDDRMVISVRTENSDGEYISTVTSTYDENGKMVFQSVRNADGTTHDKDLTGDEWDFEENFKETRNRKGVVVRRESEDGIEEFDGFDKHNNWTICRRYDNFNRLQGITRRNINYYP